MTTTTPPRTDAEARGDLAQALVPEAAGLAMAVREETREDITARLRGLSRHELEALAVVLAAMVDPDQSIRQALAWVDFDEYGARLENARPSESTRTIRAAAPRRATTHDFRGGVDEVAVARALRGDRVPLKSNERTAAVSLGMQRGMSHADLAQALGMDVEAVKRSWERTKQRARQEGRPVPQRPWWANGAA